MPQSAMCTNHADNNVRDNFTTNWIFKWWKTFAKVMFELLCAECWVMHFTIFTTHNAQFGVKAKGKLSNVSKSIDLNSTISSNIQIDSNKILNNTSRDHLRKNQQKSVWLTETIHLMPPDTSYPLSVHGFEFGIRYHGLTLKCHKVICKISSRYLEL